MTEEERLACCSTIAPRGMAAHLLGNTHYATGVRVRYEQAGCVVARVPKATARMTAKYVKGAEAVPSAYWSPGSFGAPGRFVCGLAVPATYCSTDPNAPLPPYYSVQSVSVYQAIYDARAKAAIVNARNTRRAARERRKQERVAKRLDARLRKMAAAFGVPVPTDGRMDRLVGAYVLSPEGELQQAVGYSGDRWLIHDELGWFQRRASSPGDLDRVLRASVPAAYTVTRDQGALRQGDAYLIPALVEPSGATCVPLREVLVHGRHRARHVLAWVGATGEVVALMGNDAYSGAAALTAPDHSDLRLPYGVTYLVRVAGAGGGD